MMTRKSLYCFVCWNLEKFQLCNLNVFSWEEEEKNSKNKQILFFHSYSSSSLVNSSYCFWCFFFFFLLLLLINHVNERTNEEHTRFFFETSKLTTCVCCCFFSNRHLRSVNCKRELLFIYLKAHTHTTRWEAAAVKTLIFLKYIFSCLFD